MDSKEYIGATEEWLNERIKNVSWEKKKEIVLEWLLTNCLDPLDDKVMDTVGRYMDDLTKDLSYEETRKVTREWLTESRKRRPEEMKRRAYHERFYGPWKVEHVINAYSQCRGCKHAWFECEGIKIYGHNKGFCIMYPHGTWGKPVKLDNDSYPNDYIKCEFYEKEEPKIKSLPRF